MDPQIMENPTNVDDYLSQLEAASGLPTYVISDEDSVVTLMGYVDSSFLGLYGIQSDLDVLGGTVINGERKIIITPGTSPQAILLTNSRRNASLVDYNGDTSVIIGDFTVTDSTNFILRINSFEYVVSNGTITPRASYLIWPA